MALKDKLYKYINDNQYFGTKYDIVLKNFVSKNKNTKSFKIKTHQAFDELIKDGFLKVNGHKIVNTKINTNLKNGYIGKLTKKGNIGHVQAFIDGKAETLFAPARYARKFPTDSVVSFFMDRRKGEYIAKITKVVKLERNFLIGHIAKVGNNLLFFPDDKRFRAGLKVVIRNKEQNIKHADLTNKKVKITLKDKDIIDANSNATAFIDSKEQIIGDLTNPWVYFESALIEKQIPTEFSQKALAEVKFIDSEVTQEQIENTTDYRHLKWITVDPPTTKDMDDAVAFEKIYDDNGRLQYYDIYIAIADVSRYVKPGSQIDKEAFQRGNSYYPSDYVIPMLPKELSNEICSLNPNVDRLAVVTKIRIDREGRVASYNFDRGVIKSKHKFSYQEASDLYHEKEYAVEKFGEFSEVIKDMYAVDKALTKENARNGKISIPSFESTTFLNKDKTNVLDIVNDNDVDSHRPIENLMVLKNTVAARFLNGLGVHHILRIHDFPKKITFDNMRERFNLLGIKVSKNMDNKTYQIAVRNSEKHPLTQLLAGYLVRSMQKAKYDIDPYIGHFALGTNAYSHFTSPIRRYSDLAEHRILFKALDMVKKVSKEHKIDINGKESSEILPKIKQLKLDCFKKLTDPTKLLKITTHLNECENNAKYIEGIANAVCQTMYMQRNIDKLMTGYISDFNRDSIQVTLKDENDPKHSEIFRVELQRPEDIKDKSIPKKKYNLGDNVTVRIKDIDIVSRKTFAEDYIQKNNSKTYANNFKKEDCGFMKYKADKLAERTQ